MDENKVNVSEKESTSKLSVSDIFTTLREGVLWIIIITLLFAGLGVFYALAYQKTTYTARVDAYIFTDKLYTETENQFNTTKNEISEHVAYQYCAMLAPQLKPVFTSNGVMDAVSKDGIWLKGSLNFITHEDSPYFSITYTYSQHGGDVAKIKEEVADTLNKYVVRSINAINTDENIGGYLTDKITVYSKAQAKDVTAQTGRTKIVIIATLIGFVVSVIFVLIKRLLSDTVTTKEQVETLTGNQIIATIDISSNLDNREKNNQKKEDEKANV